jgi:probable rRNA maturation factor
VDRAAEQAAAHGHGLPAELALLVVHGVLHLLGHGDETPDDAAEMRRLENTAMAAAGVAVRGPG